VLINEKGAIGAWCADGWVEIKEFMVVVPKRSRTTDLHGNAYPFRVHAHAHHLRSLTWPSLVLTVPVTNILPGD
jgi:hypothetical protein